MLFDGQVMYLHKSINHSEPLCYVSNIFFSHPFVSYQSIEMVEDDPESSDA